MSKIFVLGFFGLVLVMIVSKGVNWYNGGDAMALNIPEFSDRAQSGKVAFEDNCQACHGENGLGAGNGPPLINDIYNPGHHDDRSFYAAMKNGTRQHHWRFGNMPPQRQVKDADGTNIVQYVRELQEANGIKFKPHQM